MWNLTKTLAVEWAPLGLRVNALAPGPTETEAASAHLFPTEEIRAAMTAGIPLKRFATLEDITNAARFLLSDEGQRFYSERAEEAEYPLVAGIEPRKGLPPLESLQGPEISLGELGGMLKSTLELLNEVGLTA